MRRDKRPEEPAEMILKAIDRELAVDAIKRIIRTTAETFKPETNPKAGALGLSFEEACKQARIQAASQSKLPPSHNKSIDIDIAR